MDNQILFNDLEKIAGLSRNEQDLFLTYLHRKKLRKRQFLMEEGDIATGIFFVLCGLLRIYSIDKNGYEHILRFCPEGNWAADISSLYTGKPGSLYIDMVDAGEVLIFLKSDFEEAFSKLPLLERYFRITGQRIISDFQERLADGLSLSALERYNNFCDRYPKLIGCIPQKYIASYIGVTPEFLSKLLSTPQRKSRL